MSEMRTRLVARFRDIAAERLSTLNQDFVRLQASPDDSEAATRLKREVHTLKGESRMTGFKAVSDVCHRLEALLEGIGEVALAEERVSAVFEGLDVLEQLVAEPPGEGEGNAELEAWEERAADALRMSEVPAAPSVPETASEPAPDPDPPRAQPEPEPEVPKRPTGRQGDGTSLRVSLERLDRVTRLSGDLALDRIRGERNLDLIVQQAAILSRRQRVAQTALIRLGRPEDAGRAQLQEALAALREVVEQQRGAVELLQQVAQRTDDQDFDRGLKLLELDERVRELRFLPLSSLFARFPRAVHDLAREQGKQVELVVRGDAVELDKQVLDRIADPLLHLVRNAVDHGLETPTEREAAGKPARATITLSATGLGAAVEIAVEDDGTGVDLDRVRRRAIDRGVWTEVQAVRAGQREVLERLFDIGLSTRDTVTDISGRGVGLAVVKDTVEQLGGTVLVQSTPGGGTRFTLRVPTSVVLARVLLVRAGARTYALPVDLVRATRRVGKGSWEQVGEQRLLREEESVIPILDLHAILGLPAPTERPERLPLAILEHRGRPFALEVDAFAGQHQAVQRPLDPFVSGMTLFQGVVGTPDGDLALLLSVPELVRRGRGAGRAREAPPEARVERDRVLVVDDSEFTRDLVVQVVRDMGLDVVEAVNGRQGLDRFREDPPALVLTDLDMPVMDGFEMLEAIRRRPEGRSLPIVVFSTRGSPEDKQRAARLGADAYVVKTEFREAGLRDLVERFLGLRGPNG